MFTPRNRDPRRVPRQPLPAQQPQQAPKTVICAEGTFIEKMHEAIQFSETRRKRTDELTKEIGDGARAELINRYRARGVNPPSASMLATAVDEAISKDKRWSNAVGDEQWGGRLATMYALAELVVAQREANDLARQQLSEQRETNRLLTELIDRQPLPSNYGFRGPAYDEPI